MGQLRVIVLYYRPSFILWGTENTFLVPVFGLNWDILEYGAGVGAGRVWRGMSLTCHVAVYQLWSDGAAPIHVNEIVP